MSERPILFSAPMVRAILAGTKSQTRRLVKITNRTPGLASCLQPIDPAWVRPKVAAELCPYGRPGDRLWVREKFKNVCSGEVKNGYGEVRYGVAYAADNAVVWKPRPTVIHDLTGQPPTGPMQFRDLPWKPAIHMPRIASRITLDLTDVRVERLAAISAEDCIAEGLSTTLREHDAVMNLRSQFGELWNSINTSDGKRWASNPWVWVLCFKQAEGGK